MSRWIIALLWLGVFSASAQAAAAPPKELWLYYPTNLLVEANVDKLEEIWTRASAAGYTHVLVADSKFARLEDMDQRYFRNVDRVKAIAGKLRLTLVPALFSVGYSNDILSRDPNLAEGLPVKGTLFQVKGGEASVIADPAVSLDKISFKDDAVKMAGNVATVSPTTDNARFVFRLTTAPFRCYHASAWVRTRDYTGTPEIKALGEDRSLSFQNLGVKPTQEWTQHHVVFNSLNNTVVNLYFGMWGGGQGEMQWKDWKIEEVGLLNVLRRPGAPVVVENEGGGALKEGADYEAIVDEKMGNQPYSGEYESWHTPPTIKTKLPDGTRLRVSWHHPALIYDGQVSACISEPKFDEVLADQAKRMKAAWGNAAGGYMMSHDEIRTLNWCAACQAKHATPGKMLADNAKKCVGLLEPSNIYVWSDMFDPFHNAVKGPYYLVNGDWTGSWEGLKPSVTVVNWNGGHMDESLGFFAKRGHKQVIAGYYDGKVEDVKAWLTAAEKVQGVVGIMYTTWRNDYSQMEAFAKAAK